MRPANFIDALKGSLILLVCIGHAIQYLIYGNNGFFNNYFLKAIYIFHMPLFMAVSGYLSFNGICNSDKKVYLLRRVRSYVLPIFVWSFAYQSFAYLVFNKMSFAEFPKAVLLEALNGLWFLWALLISIFIAVVAQCTGRFRAVAFLVIFIVCMYIPDFGNFYLFKYVFPFFVMGFYINAAKIEFIPELFANIFTFGILLLCSIAIYLIWSENTFIYVSKMYFAGEEVIFLRWAGGLLFSSLFLIGFWRLYISSFEFTNKVLSDLGRDSLLIYIVQNYLFLVLWLVARKLRVSWGVELISDLVAICLGIAVAFLSLLIGKLISKNRIFEMIFFGRFK